MKLVGGGVADANQQHHERGFRRPPHRMVASAQGSPPEKSKHSIFSHVGAFAHHPAQRLELRGCDLNMKPPKELREDSIGVLY